MTGAAPREDWRRLLHLASGLLGLAAALLPSRVVTAGLLSILALAAAVEFARARLPRASAAVQALGRTLLRPAEARGITGASVLIGGYTLAWLLFPASVAAPAMMVGAAADPAAALVGRRFAPRAGRKTWAGSAAAFVVAAGVLAAAGARLMPALAGAAAAAAAERIPGRASDNLAIPVATAAALWAIA